MNMNNINQNLQFGLVSKLNTGNPIIDSVVHVFIYSFVAAIMMNLQNIFNIDNINRKFHNVYKWLTMFITRYVHQVTYTNKEVQIEYITEEKNLMSYTKQWIGIYQLIHCQEIMIILSECLWKKK
nr:AAA family ATPase [Mimivirus sp.]